MAIAGVKPVDVEVFHVNEDQIEAMITGKSVNETTEFYTREKVEEIISEYFSMLADEYYIPGPSFIDEFMERSE